MCESCAPAGGPAESADRRLHDLGIFARAFVHDIRNPLSVIRTNAYLLRQRLPEGDPSFLRPIERIEEQVDLLTQLLDGMQAFYRSDQPSFQKVSPGEVIRSVAAAASAHQGCSVEAEADPETPLITADRLLLEAALRALIRNAAEAMGGEGTILLRTRREAGQVEITVIDRGPGIPPELLERVREPFFSTRRGHAGLGLALAAKVARAHGGSLRILSRPGEGTEVSLLLPAA